MKYCKSIFGIVLILILFSCEDVTVISTNPKGVGPVNDLELAPIKDSLMQIGKQVFEAKCTQCHTMEFKNLGPDISDILANKKPEWVLNFLLNKEEMLKKDAASISTRKKYDSDCGGQIKNKQEALEVLEYLRIYQIWLHEFNALFK